jgi:hypothetical protein
MKPITICFIFSIFILQNGKSQDSLQSGKIQLLNALMANMQLIKGTSMNVHLMGIEDSTLFIYQKTSGGIDPFHEKNIYLKSSWTLYNYRFIESIKVKDKKLRAWVIPTAIVTGMVAGGFIGGALSKNAQGFEGAYASAAAITLGILIGGGVGTLAGILIGSSADKKYLINGDWKSFEEMKASLNPAR